MKKYITLFLLILFVGSSYASEDSLSTGHTFKCFTKRNRKPIANGGSFKVDPRTLQNKTGFEEKSKYNEQDNFYPLDTSIQRTPHEKTDTFKDRSIYEDIPQNNKMFKTDALPAVSKSFNAEYCTSNVPPDNTIAVSNSGYIVSAVNCGIYIYNENGQLLKNFNYPSFFNTSANAFADPRLIYDPATDRFILFLQYGSNSNESTIYIAVSSTNNPLDPWGGYYFKISGFNIPNVWFDFPSVGINQSDYFVTGNLFTDNGSFSTNLLFVLNKQDLYNGVQVGQLKHKFTTGIKDGNGATGFTIVPATIGQSGITYNNQMYFVSTPSSGGNYLTKYTLTGSAANNYSITTTRINTTSYSPSGVAVQPSNISLANQKAGCRVQSAFYLNNVVSFAYTANYNSGGYNYNSIYFNRLNVGNNSLTQNWSFLSGSNYSYPSVASFGNNSTDQSTIICFLKTDQQSYPEVRFKYYDNNMNQLASTQVRQGDNSVYYTWANEQRWGDYSTIQRKFNASQPEVWLAGSYGNSGGLWQTFIAQITGYPGLVNVEEVKFEEESLQLFPNPVSSSLKIVGDFAGFFGFPQIFNISGQEFFVDISRIDNASFQLDVSYIPIGAYIVRFNEKSLKFLKQ